MAEVGDILVVEDDEATAELERGVLVRHGRQVRVASRADEAIHVLQSSNLLMVFLDYLLDDGASWPVLAAARAALPPVPVVLVAGLSDERVAVEAMHRGAADYVVKVGSFWEHLPAIVERIASRQETQRENARLAAVVSCSSDAIMSCSLDGTIRTWNPAAERLYQYSASAAVGESLTMLVPPEGRPGLLDSLAQVHQGHRLELEGIGLRRDGSRLDVRHSMSPLTEGQTGRVVGASIIIYEITRQKQVERSLRQSELRFRALNESNLIGVVIGDVEQQVVLEANDAWLSMIGRARQDLPIRYDEITPPEYRRRHRVVEHELNIGGDSAPWEKEYLHRDGHRVPVLMGFAHVEGNQTVGFVIDLTAHRRLEQQLNQAQKMEAVGRLAGGVAHDFNNLLTVMQGYTQMALEALPEDADSRQDLERVLQAGERAVRLVSQLLSFSRQQAQAPRLLDLNQVIGEIGQMLRRLIGEDIHVETRLAPDLGLVHADPGHIEQVLLNLAVNARDAMVAGGTLTIETTAYLLGQADGNSREAQAGVKPGRYVRTAMTDTGCGMEESVLTHIFEPFFTTKGDKGTGLGLSTVYGIVQQSNGHMLVDSEVGRGTCFSMYLPVSAQKTVSESPGGAALASMGGTETILVVEDDAPISQLIRAILGRAGYHLLHAEDGAAALEVAAAETAPIHLVLTDLVMPNMGGPDLVEKLVSIHPETKVLLMSGYNSEWHGQLTSGVSFLPKPFAPNTLLTSVREALG